MIHAIKFFNYWNIIIYLEYDLNDLNDERKNSSKYNRRVWRRQRLDKNKEKKKKIELKKNKINLYNVL